MIGVKMNLDEFINKMQEEVEEGSRDFDSIEDPHLAASVASITAVAEMFTQFAQAIKTELEERMPKDE